MPLDQTLLNAPKFTNNDLEKERSTFTEEEKKEMHDDMYGTAETITVTPHQIQSLRDELNSMDEEEKRNYTTAMKRGSDVFTSDDRDLILFLRKDNLDVKAAAARIIAYWNQRVALFGDPAAFEPLGMDTLPLTEEDAEWMFPTPYFMVLPKTDAHGRRMVFGDMSLKKKTNPSVSSNMRIWWCAFHVALRDRQNPHHGDLVGLGTGGGGSTRRYGRKSLYLYFTTVSFLPIRMVCMHFCNPPVMMEYIAPFVLFIAGRHLRNRFHVHVGTRKAVLRQLEEFGLKKEVLPVAMGGEQVTVCLKEKKRRRNEI